MHAVVEVRRADEVDEPALQQGVVDMVVTHLVHVLGLVDMEPPTTLEARSIVEETGKVFRSVAHISPDDVIRGQYTGYREGMGTRPRAAKPPSGLEPLTRARAADVRHA